MAAWSASRLPKVRDGLQRLLSDPDSALRRNVADTPLSDTLAHVARSLGVAELYWVMPEMAALAVGAAESLPEVRWSVVDRPAAHGLLVWDGGIGTTEYQGVLFPVDAVSWGPHPDGLLVMAYLRRARINEVLAKQGAQVDTATVPPLVPLGAHVLPVVDEPQPADQFAPTDRTLLTTIASTWSLMQQPTIADRSQAEVDRQIRRAYGRAGRADPEVTLVDLRRQYRPSDQEPPEPDAPGRHYRHRWIVRGHWRQQAYGPERALRRPTWIPAYVKGPEGAELLETTRVNVWRR